MHIFKELRVGDLTSLPRSLVCRVGNTRSDPFTLVGRIGNTGWFPFTASNFVALGVGNGNCLPLTVFFVVPVNRLLGLGIGNFRGFVIKPTFGLLVVGVVNL
jgi:hypothetical protein